MKIVRAITIIFVLLAANPVFASDWPQYLGPDRNAVSSEKGFLRSWPADGPKVLWTIPLGEGYGGPAVSEGKVYIYDRVDNKTNILRCLDFATGKEEWTFSNEAPGSVDHNGTRSTPAIDGNRIYVCDPFGNFHCLDMNTHKVLWQKNIWTDFGGTDLPRWAISQNPLIYQNMVIVASQTDNAGLVAYDKQTGNVIWKTSKLPGSAGYVSPTIVKISEEDHLVMISASGRGNQGAGAVSGYDPKTGAPLWSYSGFQCRIPVPNVTVLGNNRLFVTGAYRAGAAIIQIEKADNSYSVKVIMTSDEFGSHCHPAILYKDHLYANYTTNEVRDGMVCMDFNGTVKWKTKTDPLFDRGGNILVDDMIINMDGNGTLYLIEPSPDGFKMLASAKLLDTKEAWAPLALSDGKLLIRDQKQMKCIQVK